MGIAPAGNLLAPSGLIAEEDRVTRAMISLLEVVASLETRECLGLGDNTAGAVIVSCPVLIWKTQLEKKFVKLILRFVLDDDLKQKIKYYEKNI